jgi:RHS repeat-associated protein
MHGRRWRVPAIVLTVCALGAALLAAVGSPASAGAATKANQIWSPFPVAKTASVKGHPLAAGHHHLTVHEPVGVPAQADRPPAAAAWPAAGSGLANLGGDTAAGPGQEATPAAGVSQPDPSGQAGTLPVWVSAASVGRSADAAADGAPAPATVRVTMASRKATLAAGANGVVMSLARADGTATRTTVSVRLDYSAFAGEYGGGWGSRLRLVELPACALTTPGEPACRRQTPLAGENEAASQQLTATVPVSGSAMVVAATSTVGGAEGTYAATSLKPSGSWAVQDGDFSYTYPITVPPALGGSAPSVGLTYDSQSIDGETSGTNTQASWIGDGWNYSPGFIERSYQPCSQDGISASGDLCWGGYNATLSLGSVSSPIVRDDATGTWHLQNDNGATVQDLSGAGNGVWNGEYWLVTMPDGTKYYFGLNKLPGGNGSDAATDSAWGEPVYSPDSGNPCYSSSSGTASECQMGYRWNLDYVVDPAGNLTEYDYATESNYYQMGGGQGKGTLTQYVRGGYPTQISYGWLLSQAIAGAEPAAQVEFGVSQRCLTSSTFTNCAYSNLSSSTAAQWPDTPFDQNCGSTGTCAVDSPTFWSTVRLTSITTQVLEGSTYQPVDGYALTQSFPDAGGGAATPVMFLNSIQHTGEDGTAVSLPPVTFTPTEIDNRVDGLVPAATPLYRPRIAEIATEYGSDIGITYAAPACSRVNNTMPSSAAANTMPCYPVYWTPTGESSPIEDWFNKSLVTQVDVADETGASSPTQVTNYSYLGGAAWHYDDSPLTEGSQRTWDQFRGYAQVETTAGAAPDPVTESITTYMRGMDGDDNGSGGTTSVSVADSLGDSVTDSNWLAGQILETDSYTGAGGTVDAKAINGPWTYTQTASQAQPDGLPTLTAEMPQATESRSLALRANGSWRSVQTDTTDNADDQVTKVDAKGDGTAADPEICTTTTYASGTANPMMESYPSRVLAVDGPCGTTPTTGNTVSDTLTFYDGDGNGSLTSLGTPGAITNGGQVTGTQVISGYGSSGSPQYQTKAAATFDEYGRQLTSVDAKGNVTGTAYTPAAGALPTSATVTNPMGWPTTTTLDPARDQPLTVTDANGETTTETYDSLGRLTAVWLPGRPTSDSANDTYSYTVTGTTPTYTTSSALRENGTYAATVDIYDGMLQLRETQATPNDAEAGRLVSDTFYDSHGWTVKTSSSYYDSSSSPDGTMFVAVDDKVPSQTVTDYDGQGRPVESKFYSLAQYQWETTTAYPGADETDVTPPSGGTATSTFTDALGQTTASWAYDDSATPTGKASDARVTSYTYTPGGQVATVTDNAGNKWSYGYNLLGQQVTQTDPDAGTTTYAYDPDGNQISSTDPRGQTLAYTYDALNRKTAEYSGSVSPANELASWKYDTLAKGQVTSSASYVGGASGSAYTEAVTGYDDAYQPTGTSLTIPSAEGSLAGSYTTADTYSPITNELQSTAYSAGGGLSAETVHYSYDTEGLVSSIDGATPYLDTVIYDPFGNVDRTTTGLYGSQLAVTSAYDAGTQRLLQTTDNVQTASSAVDTTNYTYNDSGAVTSVSDAQSTGQTDTQCFDYNDLSELTTAWTDTAGTSTASAPSVGGIGGCTTATPSASTIGGPSPYWESWTYDPLGDRTSETVDNTAGDTSDNQTQTLTYPGGNGTSQASQPNAVSAVATTGPGGTTNTTYAYNAAGDTTGRTSTSTGASPPAGPDQSFTYNPQDQVASVTTTSGGTSQTSDYLYDADGNLLIQRDPGTTTLYLDNGAEELQLNTSTNTVSGTRYYSEPDGTTVVRSSTGALTYELGNQQGTNTETINASTLAVTRRYYDPYGNPRGSIPSSWVDNRGFLNQPADATTGLDLLGARQYDSVTGRFLSVDTVFEAGDPRQMGGYSYAADNPVNGSDPEGTDYIVAGGGPCGLTVHDCVSHGGGGGGGGGSHGGGNGQSNGQGSNGGSSLGTGCWEPGGEYTCGAPGSSAVAPALTAPPFNAPKPAPQATRAADPFSCGRFGTGCSQIAAAASSSGSASSCFIVCGWGNFTRKAVQVVGNVTGANAILQCAEHASFGTCSRAVMVIGMDVSEVATDGADAPEVMAEDSAIDATADVTAEAGGDGAADLASPKVLRPGEVWVGDVNGNAVVKGGTVLGNVHGTAVITDGGTVIGDVQNVIQIGSYNVIGRLGPEGANSLVGNVHGFAVQAGEIDGEIIVGGSKVWPLTDSPG